MSGPPSLIDDIRAALSPHGLFLRGSLHLDGDGPDIGPDQRARTVLLIGHEGSSHWSAFRHWQAISPDGDLPDPLDRWSKAVLMPIAQQFDAKVFFPSDPPFQPFQQWAMRAEGLKASPLGILIHPRLGLWHGYRAALAFADPLDGAGAVDAGPFPCDTCQDKPCLRTCPASAILPEGFQYQPCRSHLARAEGVACLEQGCLARNACPVGAEYRYTHDQLRFHMAALKR